MGLVLGFVPTNPGEDTCGSPFAPGDDNTEVCETVGGNSDRRAYAFALILGGMVLLLGAGVGVEAEEAARRVEGED